VYLSKVLVRLIKSLTELKKMNEIKLFVLSFLSY